MLNDFRRIIKRFSTENEKKKHGFSVKFSIGEHTFFVIEIVRI